MIRCTVGVLAYNEAQNVLRTLHALLDQRLEQAEIVEIIVIASGCTDGTAEIAAGFASVFPIVTVDVETRRTGKAAAIKRLMSIARGEVIVLVGADTLPDPTALEHLVAPFADTRVGMTGARAVPLNAPDTWTGFAVQMMWHAHHRLAMRRPKLGELVAFRNVIQDFPEDTSTDEPALEALITAKGYRLVYAPKAVVYNHGPRTSEEFLNQRRRIGAGQVRIALRYGYFTSSMRLSHAVPLAIDAFKSYPRHAVWILGAMAFEVFARVLGAFDVLRDREPVVWSPIKSSKSVAAASETLTLMVVRWESGSLDVPAFLRNLEEHAEPHASVFWWDGQEREVMLRLQSGESPLKWFESRVKAASQSSARAPIPAGSSPVSWRLVTFTPPNV